jgi:RNA polymerase sigma-70 factor (ECF subfamily)
MMERATLSAIFLCEVAPPHRPEVTDWPELEHTLASLIDAGERAWPGLPRDRNRFLRHLAKRLQPGAGCPALRSLHAADLYLACACTYGDGRALAELDRGYLSLVKGWVAHIGRDPAFTDEVGQVLRERLLLARPPDPPRIGDYAGAGPLSGWLRISALRTAYNLLRAEGARAGCENIEPTSPALAQDAELALLRAEYQDEFRAAFANTLADLPASERNLLRLHYLDGLTLDELSPLFRLHKSSLSRALARARESILSQTRRRLAEQIGLPDREVDSILVFLRSQLDLSLRRLLAPKAAPSRGRAKSVFPGGAA